MKRREFIALLGIAPLRSAVAASPQQLTRSFRIAVVHPSFPETRMTDAGDPLTWGNLFQELRLLGYEEGKNLVVMRYSGNAKPETYPKLAADVVRSKPDAVFVVSSRMVRLFQEAASEVPIIGIMADPIEGPLPSPSDPGKNITGFTIDAGLGIWAKRIELLREIMPKLSHVGFVAPNAVWDGPHGAAVRDAADQLGLAIVGLRLETPIQDSDYHRVFASIREGGAGAIVLSESAEHTANRQLIIELVKSHSLPGIFPFREYVRLGGLMSYGLSLGDLYRKVALYIDRVFRGTEARKLPIQQPTNFELMLNLQSARLLGLTVPPALLARADEVIE